jgi:hypothetical protein
MHAHIDAALKALYLAEEVYARAVANVEGQYLKSLESISDGDSAECGALKAQIAGVRSKYLKSSVAAPVVEPVRSRFEAERSKYLKSSVAAPVVEPVRSRFEADASGDAPVPVKKAVKK